MTKTAVGFRIDADKKAALEEVAALTGANFSEAVNAAIDGYIDIQQHQIKTIKQRIKEADAGEIGVPHDKAMAMFREHIKNKSH